jgi:hypothetical protein
MIRSPESQGLLADLKREQSSTLAKPALNEETFQRLLSAAYTLQQHNGRRLVNQPTQQAAAFRAAVPETATFKRPQSKPAQLLPLIQRAVSKATNVHRYRMGRRRISQSNELLWRTATVIAIAAVLALLLVGTATVVTETPAETKTRRTDRTVVVGQPRAREIPATARETTVKPKPHYTYENEADVVAKDTVVRYGTGSSR